MVDKWKVDWKVEINGQDMTAGWQSVLQSIAINDQAGEASDSCDLRLDDTGGQILLPRKRSPVTVTINGARLFRGFVEKSVFDCDRNGGRTLNVSAKGMDSGSKVKQPQSFNLDDADLGTFLGQMADNAGINLKVDEGLASIQQDYWAADGESLIAMGQRVARKYGGTFKIRGDQAVLARRGAGAAPGGVALPVVDAVFGRNLVSCSITPREPRRQFGSGQARWFDRAKAAFESADLDFGNDDFPVVNILRPAFADEDEAEAVLDARKRESEWEGGEGSANLDFTLGAVVEGTCRVSGMRTGVDGTYVIASVKHNANRSGGASTSLELKQPGGEAGKDGRKAGESSFALPRHERLG